MKIYLKKAYSPELIFEADNVRVVEDIESREYSRDENGKYDFTIPPKRDIDTSVIEQIVNLLSEMMYHRNAPFDSSDLITMLFDKLPSEVAETLSEELANQYKREK